MTKVRELRIHNMWAHMLRLQDENDPTDASENPDDDEIYGIVVVVERDASGRVDSTVVEGSDVYISVGEADRNTWFPLSPQGTWVRRNYPADARLEITWILLEEDSIFDADLSAALEELKTDLLGEFEDVPGISRMKALFGIVERFLAAATSDDRLGSTKEILNLARDGSVNISRSFDCRGSNAHYYGWARAQLGPPH